MDFQILVFLFPAGVILRFRELWDEHMFVIIYALVGTYFAGVMVRLMLTLTPCVCVTAAVALLTVLDIYIDPRKPETQAAQGDSVSVADTANSEGQATDCRNYSTSSCRGSRCRVPGIRYHFRQRQVPSYCIFGQQSYRRRRCGLPPRLCSALYMGYFLRLFFVGLRIPNCWYGGPTDISG